jgi:hypothetical protein
MSKNMVQLFVSRLQGNFEAWHDGDIDYATLNEQQRMTWVAIFKMGAEVAAAVERELRAGVPILHGGHGGCDSDPAGSSFKHREYSARIERTDAGSPSLKISATSLGSGAAGHRQVAAFVYELAASLERLSQVVDAHWSIVADPSNGCVVVQLAGDHETELAYHLLAELIHQHDLA